MITNFWIPCDQLAKDIGAEEDSVFIRILQALAIPVTGNVCYVFMHGLNHVQVCGSAFGVEPI